MDHWFTSLEVAEHLLNIPENSGMFGFNQEMTVVFEMPKQNVVFLSSLHNDDTIYAEGIIVKSVLGGIFFCYKSLANLRMGNVILQCKKPTIYLSRT